MSNAPSYPAIAQRKQAHLESQIPAEWKLPASQIPSGMLSLEDSITNAKQYQRVNVMNVPRTCGLLTGKELEITENWDIRGLLRVIAEKRYTTEDVVRAFCKRAAISHQVTRCLSEPLFDRALQRAKDLDRHLQNSGKPIGPLHGLPVSVKDSFHVKGVDSTTGIVALAFKPATQNSPLVDLLESLGAVIIGKTNVPQTMGTLDSCNHLFGRTLNPLNRQWTAGGSTGGEGALIAMRGSMVGFGTDIGGSVRVPAMCNGIYGFKPSVGRFPAGGQDGGHIPGKGRVSLQAVVGPLARSVADLGAIMEEVVPRAELFGEDCIPGRWHGEFPLRLPETQARNVTIGVLRSDGIVEPLPPIAKVLDEVAQTLRKTPGVEVVEIPVPAALAKCQGLAGRLMGVDGGGPMMDLLESTGEPLIPWLQGRMKRGRELTLSQLGQLQAQRSIVERELLKMWTLNSGTGRRIDAIIHPVAPHPVPEIDRYNAVGYTSSFVLLDYPAATIPVRPFRESDLESGKEMDAPVLGSWDKANRQLWNEKTVDRRVYLDSPLSIQVVTPKQHDYELFRTMEIIDRAVRVPDTEKTAAKL
ncbi:amidase signature domain-containing protein [Aspergillus pseudonomiae]|uniref:Amidase signature domain-containing protein n=1 Tax=Aspergillus pseudonomiae TaxID=1506151 RepID=A0A5N7DSZ1_9EURO|nr:amidase signature domain-containing protein [Aspergillus pseudonomiae]KAE8409415.1 amidase signature domain-containing protein [Aspergillus pseudonomiae]